jgi:KDO2-lipid IV(A) lauroyltransferase
VRAAFRLMAAFPSSVSLAAGITLGRIGAALPIPRLRVALDNINTIYGESLSPGEIKALYRRIFVHFGRMIFEVPKITRLRAGNIKQFAEVEGLANLESVLSRGKGCFFLAAHFGNWELLNAAVSISLGGRMAIVARPLDFPPLEKIVSSIRGRFGTEIIPKRKAMRRILKSIKGGVPVGIMLDQNVDWYEGVFVPFMGRVACANKALAVLALKTWAPVVPVFTVRLPDGRYRVIIEKELDIIRTGDETLDVEENTRLFTHTIERYVKDYPDHWFWFHRRWKTRPYCALR